jgi:hypothetical protein
MTTLASARKPVARCNACRYAVQEYTIKMQDGGVGAQSNRGYDNAVIH